MLTAERTPAYLTILYALLLFRRDHELEPLHEDVLPRIAEAAAGLGGYDGPTFAQDVSQLVEWGAVERVTEARRLRGPRDNRRERFRYRLTDDAVALLEWLEARLAAKLAGRVGDSRDRLEDVVGHLRELRRVLDAWRGGEREPDRARRALYLIEAIGDTIDAVGGELLAFRAEMLGFASRPYDLDALRAILAWLDRYVAVYVARLQALRDDIAARLTDLAAPRYRDALAACGAAVADERALAPRAAAMPPSPLAVDERLAAHAEFFAPRGRLAQHAARIDESARAVIVKMQHHVRELERRSARLGDLRAAITAVAACAARDPRLGELGRGLLATAHARLDRRPGTAAAPGAPATPRAHVRATPPPAARPLARKRGSLDAARALAARRQAELAGWLAAVLGDAPRARLSALGAALTAPDAPRRWLDVARAAHLGGGRALRALGVALAPAGGEATLGDTVSAGLAAPDVWITRPDRPGGSR